MKAGIRRAISVSIILSVWTPLYSAEKDKLKETPPGQRSKETPVAETPVLVSKLDPDDVRGRLAREKGGVPLGEEALGKVVKRGSASVKRVVHDKQDAPYSVIFDGAGEVEIEKPKRRSKGQSDVTFYTFKYRSSVGASFDQVSTVSLGGAVLGFRRSKSGTMGELVAFSGDNPNRAGRSDWMSAGVMAPLSGDSVPIAADLMVRTDSKKGIWDLYYRGSMRLANLPYSRKAEKVIAKSLGRGASSVSELKIWDDNPEFLDDNLDGVPDGFSRAFGGARRDDVVTEEGDLTLLDLYLGN